MRNLVKLLLWLAGLAVIAVCAVILTIVSIDPNEHRDWIEAKFREQTGRELDLEGDIEFTLYPWLGLEANGIRIGNAPGFGDTPFLSLDYVKLRAKSLPLLREEYILDTVHLRGARIHLDRNEQGVSNWEDLIDDDEPKRDAPLLPLAAISLGGVAVENAALIWNDRQAGVRHEVSGLNLSTAELRYGEPIALSLDFHGLSDKPAVDATVRLAGAVTYAREARQYAVSPLDMSVSLKGRNVPGGAAAADLSAGIAVNLDDETLTVSDLRIDALETVIAGDLNAGNIESPAPSIAASLSVKGPDLSLWFKLAEVEPLASQLARLADRSFHADLVMDADLERGDVDLSELSARLLGAVVSGEIKARNIHSDKPDYQGSLDAKGPDLPTLMQVIGQLQAGGNSPLTVYGKKLAGNRAKAFRVATRFDADLKSGDVSIPALSFDALGISATGALDARNMHTRKGTISGNLSIRGAGMAGLLRAFDQPELAQALRSVELDTRLLGTRADMSLAPLTLKAVFDGPNIPAAPAGITLDADARIDLNRESLVLDEFTLSGSGLKLTGNLDADGIFSKPAFAGQIDVQPFNLRRLVRQLGGTPPATAGNKALTRVALSGRFDSIETGLDVRELELQLDDTRMTGGFSVVDMREKPAVRFDLDIDEINLDHYLPPEPTQGEKPSARRKNQGAGNNEETATDAASGGGPAALSAAAGHRPALDGELAIGRLIVANARLSGVKLRLNAGNGVLKADPVTADLYQGSLSGNIELNLSPDNAGLELVSKLEDIRVEDLLRDVTGKAKIRGKGDFSAVLSASGNTGESIKRSLNGRMSMNLNDGAIIGFNLGEALRKWKQFKRGRIYDVRQTEATDFIVLTGNPVVEAGVIRMDDLDARASGFRLTGRGVLADLGAGIIDYRVVASVAERPKKEGGAELSQLAGLELPVKIRGPLNSPRVEPDWGDVLASLLVNRVAEEISDRITDRIRPRVPAAGADKAAANESNTDKSETETETEQERKIDPVEELIKEGLKGIFGK